VTNFIGFQQVSETRRNEKQDGEYTEAGCQDPKWQPVEILKSKF